ncbi:MAG: MFS transporter [Oscillospiraceae bacterium]|jgi:MFS family permease|nr:MFS transporter [Oscillospiraceae bacterium]
MWNRNFVCVVITNTLLCLGHASVNPIVASYAKYLGAGDHLTGLLTGMFYGVALAIRPVAGPVTARAEKRTLLIAVFAIGGIANLGYAVFQTIPLFVLFRFLTGIQYGFVGSLIMTLAGDSLPPEKMASGMGVYGVGAAIGTAVAPTVGIRLLNLGTAAAGERFGFKLAFLFASAMMFLSVIPSVILLPERKTDKSRESTGPWYSNILSPRVLPPASVMFLLIISFSLYNVYMVQFAQEQFVKERDIEGISTFFLVMAGTLMLSRPLSGWLTDKYGVVKTMYPGMAVFALSFVIVAFSKSLATVLIGAAVAALGYGTTQPAVQAMCLQSVPRARSAVASNTAYIGMDLGLFAGPLYGSFIFERFNFSVMYMTAIIPIAAAIIAFTLIMPGYRRLQAQIGDGER